VTFKGAVTFSTVNPQGQVIGSPVVVKKGETTSAAPNTPPEAPKAIPKEELKKLDVETASTASAQKESAAASTAEPTAAGNQSTRESASEGNKTEQSTSGSRSAEPVAGSDSRSSASSTEASSAAAPSSMVDKKDLDIGQAREIKDVKAGANLPPPPPKPPMSTVTVPDSSRVREIIRDNTGKSKVIVTPEIKN
jgi:hypothetical protein